MSNREQATRDVEALIGVGLKDGEMVIQDRVALTNFYFATVERLTEAANRASQSKQES